MVAHRSVALLGESFIASAISAPNPARGLPYGVCILLSAQECSLTARKRTQIYLTRAELSVLDRIKGETGVSQSELVRRAIDRTYLAGDVRTREERLAIVDKAAGAWAGRSETGAQYVERLRSGRLSRTYARRR